jgi:hypothetical protein
VTTTCEGDMTTVNHRDSFLVIVVRVLTETLLS